MRQQTTAKAPTPEVRLSMAFECVNTLPLGGYLAVGKV